MEEREELVDAIVAALPSTCAVELAQAPASIEAVATWLDLSNEGVRQAETRAAERLRSRLAGWVVR